MKKIVPAVFFQKQRGGETAAPKKPKRLELFDDELREVVGGRAPDDGSGGTVTYSGSDGWADVANADDCAG